MGGANNTKTLLAESLQDLMRTHPLEKISVNDIVEHAGVGRNTFYYHFADKYDLVNWCFQKGIMQFLTENPTLGNWQTIASQLEQYFRDGCKWNCLQKLGVENEKAAATLVAPAIQD